jgi:1-acyl-sn-glycerol-3-phosphate acyltransferase
VIRSLWVALTLAVGTLIFAPPIIIARMLGVADGPESIYDRCMRRWARMVIRAAGVRVRIRDDSGLAGGGGAVYISNHVSWFDVFALAATLPRYTFVAKEELSRIPLFGPGARAAGVVFLDRANRKAAFKSYETAAQEVKRGRAIVVFPEGTRGLDYHLRPFKKGPFVLAIAAQSPIVPTLVHGAREVMPKGSFRIRPGPIDIHFLPTVSTAGCDYEHRAELVERVWHQMADVMRSEYAVVTSEHPIAAAARDV